MGNFINRIIQFAKIKASQTNPEAGSQVVVNVEGMSGINDDSNTEGNESEVYGSLGVVGRPIDATDDGYHAESVCIRTDDGIVAIAIRDTRIEMGGNAPGEGTIALVGYGNGYHAITPVDTEDLTKGSIQTIYCGYAHDSGTGLPTKAHSITLDPTDGNSSISLIHADGMAITMSGQDKKALLMKNAAGDATIRVDDDGVTITAATIVLSGGVITGDPATAVPLLAGVASPPSTKLYVSP